MFPNSVETIGKKLLDELVRNGKVSDELSRAIRVKYKTVAEIVNFVLTQGKVSEEDIVKASAVTLGINYIHLVGKTIDRDVLNIIPENVARQFGIIAYELNDEILKVAVGRPYYLNSSSIKDSQTSGPLSEIEKQKNIKIELCATTISDINWALAGYFQKEEIPTKEVATLFNAHPVTKNVADNPNFIKPSADIVNNDSIPAIDLSKSKIQKNVLLKFPKEIAQKYNMVVFEILSKDKIKVAALEPQDRKTKEILEFIEKRNGIKIDLYQTDSQSLATVIKTYQEYQPETQIIPASGTMENVEIGALPAGKSPDHGGKTKDGIEIIGAKDISAVLSPPPVAGQTVKATENLEERNLDQFLGVPTKSSQELAQIVRSGFAPKMVGAILSLGIFLKASDIHLEPLRNFFRLRYRVDGELAEYLYMPLTISAVITSRIKILSNLKIDEQRIPQDGRYDATAQGHEFDVRVSSLPTVHGEKIVMRLLDKSAGAFTLDQLGFSGDTLTRLTEQIKKPWGVVLSTGPTGSGKSTTLYAILNQIANPKVNVITLEDPVEYEMKGVNQVQVKPKIGFSFAEGLRSILRQDPNIIMVGEIRDSETAELATHAALTGHLVLSTLHTNNAAGALPRLINMGVEPFLITSAINAIIAQRLVRKLCQKCKLEARVPSEVVEKVKGIIIGLKEIADTKELKFYRPKGCDECHNGYQGRIGIYEVLIMSDKIEETAIKNLPASEIEDIAKGEGMVTMQQDGIIKAIAGLTSLDEVLKVTSADKK